MSREILHACSWTSFRLSPKANKKEKKKVIRLQHVWKKTDVASWRSSGATERERKQEVKRVTKGEKSEINEALANTGPPQVE